MIPKIAEGSHREDRADEEPKTTYAAHDGGTDRIKTHWGSSGSGCDGGDGGGGGGGSSGDGGGGGTGGGGIVPRKKLNVWTNKDEVHEKALAKLRENSMRAKLDDDSKKEQQLLFSTLDTVSRTSDAKFVSKSSPTSLENKKIYERCAKASTESKEGRLSSSEGVVSLSTLTDHPINNRYTAPKQ